MKTKKKKRIAKWWKAKRKKMYKAICTFIATLLCISCGSTKAVVSRTAEGTYTTITITTNNPITTTPTTDLNLKVWDKK